MKKIIEKLDKDRNVTKEYLDYVSSLEREDLEKFFIGADLLVDRLENVIKEVREYISNSGGMELVNSYSFPEKPIIDKLAKTDLLEILDKVNNNEDN